MTAGISMKKIWFDDDMVELEISVFNGRTALATDVYVGHVELADLVKQLQNFRHHVRGGIHDITFGAFGPEYAHGAFHARLHFQDPGRLFVTARTQSDFWQFGKKNVANEGVIHLVSEPVLLDNFIAELKNVSEKKQNDAVLAAIH